MTPFGKPFKLKPDETIVFSWIVWPSKAVRDAGHPEVVKDPRMQTAADMPFDGKRMIYGGFDVLFEG